LYDCSYPILLRAGRFVRSHATDYSGAYRRNLAILALGLASWNQGSRSAWHAEPLIGNAAALIQLLKALENLKPHLKRRLNRAAASAALMEILKSGGELIGLTDTSSAISVLSKLLHFVSPRYFVIYDTHVAKGFGSNPDQEDYETVQLTLWALGFHRRVAPKDGCLARYWSSVSSDVYPMRLVDCTFYRR
jgi:hypothetical protein